MQLDIIGAAMMSSDRRSNASTRRKASGEAPGGAKTSAPTSKGDHDIMRKANPTVISWLKYCGVIGGRKIGATPREEGREDESAVRYKY